MDTSSSPATTIFRFKLSDDIVDKINQFAKIHSRDDRKTYKEEWSKWFNENNAVFEEEIIRLTRLGYIGNVEYKMFNAGRYYFRNKKDNNNNNKEEKKNYEKEERKEKKTRLYISTSKVILDAMDNHIRDTLKDNKLLFTPASGYNEFCKLHIALLADEIKRIYNTFDKMEHINANDISSLIIQKIKKTYKNRYFIITHK